MSKTSFKKALFHVCLRCWSLTFKLTVFHIMSLFQNVNLWLGPEKKIRNVWKIWTFDLSKFGNFKTGTKKVFREIIFMLSNLKSKNVAFTNFLSIFGKVSLAPLKQNSGWCHCLVVFEKVIGQSVEKREYRFLKLKRL